MDIYFTVQRSHSMYFSSDFGVMKTTKALANGEDFDLEPLMVAELRFPEEIFRHSSYASNTQFFTKNDYVDLVAWIAGTILKIRSTNLSDAKIIIDPFAHAALTDTFHRNAESVGLTLEIGDRSNKRHVAHFNQCQKQSFFTVINSDQSTSYPKEPLGLSIAQLNRCSGSMFHPMLGPAMKLQLEPSNINVNLVPKKAVKVSSVNDMTWQQAEIFDGRIQSGILLLEQDSPNHIRNRVYQSDDVYPLDPIAMRHLLSLVPDKEVFVYQLSVATGRSFPVTAADELIDFVKGKSKSLFDDIQYALNDLFNQDECESAVFHVGATTKAVTESVVNAVTCGWDYEQSFLLYKSEDDNAPVEAVVFLMLNDFWAFVAAEASTDEVSLVDLLGDAIYANGRPARFIAPDVCSLLQELDFGLMPYELGKDLSDFFKSNKDED